MWVVGVSVVAVLVIYAVHWIIMLTSLKSRNRSSLPPGSMGFPFIGETLQLMIPSYSLHLHPFIRKRIQRFGPIFRTSLFGKPVVISTDPEFNNYLIQQEGRLVELWAGPITDICLNGIYELDNIIKYMRSITLSHVGAGCIREKLIPQFEVMFGETMHKWSTQTSVEVRQSTTKMAFHFFAKHYFGYDAEELAETGRISDHLFTDYFEGLKTIPLNIPGSTYHKCLETEHEEILRSRDKSSSSISWNEYKSMKFTQQVINEALRFSLLIPGLLRIALKDIDVKEYTIPAGWIILAVTPTLHMNSEIYKDPLTFNPWRWKDLDSYTVSKHFKPFGGGSRQCPGADLTRAFMATFIHVLVTNYRWTKIKGGRVVRNPILGFGDGIHIKVWEKHN